MNLAEIRRKADEAKKTDGSKSVAATEIESAADYDSDQSWPTALPDTDVVCENTADPVPEEMMAASRFDADFSRATDMDTEKGLFSGVTEQQSACCSEPLAEIVSGTDLPEPGTVKPVFDPMAIILAGRASVSDDEDVSSGLLQTLASSEVDEYLCFRVADEKYALSIMAIKEIIKPREVTEVPRMPEFISGVISLRGVIIPVMDMRLRLSLSVGEITGRERVIVLKTNAGFCGVLVDEVIQVVRVNRSAIEAPPAVLDGIDREFVKGLGRVDNRMLILLNLESILDLGIH